MATDQAVTLTWNLERQLLSGTDSILEYLSIHTLHGTQREHSVGSKQIPYKLEKGHKHWARGQG